MKHSLGMATFALILSVGIAHAGPCNGSATTSIRDDQVANSAAQVGQRQEHAQPSVAQQPTSTGKAAAPSPAQNPPEPSAKMTDQDRFSGTGTHSGSSETSAKMTDQDC